MLSEIFVSINLWAVLVATVVYIAIGWLWYSEYFFGSAYKTLSGIKSKKLNKDECRVVWLSSIVVSFLVTVIVANFVENLDNTMHAYSAITVVWLFVALEAFHTLIWENGNVRAFLIKYVGILVKLLLTACVYCYALAFLAPAVA